MAGDAFRREELFEDEGGEDEEETGAGRALPLRAGVLGVGPRERTGPAEGGRPSSDSFSWRHWQHAVIAAPHNDDDRVRITGTRKISQMCSSCMYMCVVVKLRVRSL